MTLHSPATRYVSIERRQFQVAGEPLLDPVAFAIDRLTDDEQVTFGGLAIGESMTIGASTSAPFTLTRTR